MQNGVEIRHAEESFFKLIAQKGLPSRYKRFCCGVLKEYKILDTAILGIRKEESVKRKRLYNEPTACRFYGSKANRVEHIYPILEWTEKDVKDFIEFCGIKLHPYYYDRNGMLHTERRLGCMLCPLARDMGVSYYKQYPKLVRLTIRALGKYRQAHSHVKTIKMFRDEFEQFTYHLFFQNLEDFYMAVRKDIFGQEVSCRNFLEDFFKIEL